MFLPLLRTALVPLCLFAASAYGQSAPTGSISGSVVDARTGQRMGGVTVEIAGGGLKQPTKLVTGSDGQFYFSGLLGGSYAVEARRSGYLDGAFGRRRPSGPSVPLRLSEDERREGITIELFKPAAITGTITDEAGEPAVRVEVRAYRRTFYSGRPVMSPVEAQMTDDRGVYRIGRLAPGDYVIAVPLATSSPMPGPNSTPANLNVRDGGSSVAHLPPLDGRLQKFAVAYYPAGTTAAQASIITLDQGEVRRAVDVQLHPTRVFNIAGAIIDTSSTGNVRGVQVELIAAGEEDIAGDRAIATALTGFSGSFSIPAVPGGQYVLRALAMPKTNDPADPPQWAEQQISISDKDLTDIALPLRRGVRVTGRIVLDGANADADQRLQGMSVQLDPASVRITNIVPAGGLDASGRSFTVTNVLPGRYLVRANSPGGWTVKSVMYQGRDVSQSPFAVDISDVAGLVITLTDRPTVLAGSVSGVGDISTARVLVFPQDPQSWIDFGGSPVTMRTAGVLPTGGFEMRGLPPGDYLVVACSDETAVDWQNPEFLQAAARVATHARIGEGVVLSVDLKVVDIK